MDTITKCKKRQDKYRWLDGSAELLTPNPLPRNFNYNYNQDASIEWKEQ